MAINQELPETVTDEAARQAEGPAVEESPAMSQSLLLRFADIEDELPKDVRERYDSALNAFGEHEKLLAELQARAASLGEAYEATRDQLVEARLAYDDAIDDAASDAVRKKCRDAVARLETQTEEQKTMLETAQAGTKFQKVAKAALTAEEEARVARLYLLNAATDVVRQKLSARGVLPLVELGVRLQHARNHLTQGAADSCALSLLGCKEFARHARDKHDNTMPQQQRLSLDWRVRESLK